MSERVAGGRIRKLPRRSREFAAGRTCNVAGCETVLSRYNPTDRCWAHRELKPPRLRGRT